MKFIVKEEIFRSFPGMRIITAVGKGIGASSDETAVERVLRKRLKNLKLKCSILHQRKNYFCYSDRKSVV